MMGTPINGPFPMLGYLNYAGGLEVAVSNVNVAGTWASCSRVEFPDRGNAQSADKDGPVIQALACAHVLNLSYTHSELICVITICWDLELTVKAYSIIGIPNFALRTERINNELTRGNIIILSLRVQYY